MTYPNALYKALTLSFRVRVLQSQEFLLRALYISYILASTSTVYKLSFRICDY